MNGRIDYQKDKYNPYLHSNIILHKIIEFNSVESNLVLTDAATFISGMGTASFLWLSSAGFFSYLILGAAFHFGKDQVTGRNKYRKQFLEQLLELLDIYKWCAKTGDELITHDETFLTLLNTIAVFVPEGKELLPQGREYSATFKKILSQSPHHMQFLEEKKEVSFPFSMSSLFFKQPTPKEPLLPNIQFKEQPEWIRSFKSYFYKEQKAGEGQQEDKRLPDIVGAVEMVKRYFK